MTRYSRQDVLRILHLQPRQLVAWEREGLIPVLREEEFYSFEHMTRLRSLREMRSKRLSARSIKAQVDAMQRVAGMRNPLSETSTVRQGLRLAFRHGGALVDAVTQQLAFDFAVVETGSLRSVRGTDNLIRLGTQPQSLRPTHPEATGALQEQFVEAVRLEESAATLDEAIALYRQILLHKQDHAPACINLGTIFYNQREFEAAEAMYRRATEADPHYALAYFDLGNVLDEMQQLPEAIAAYKRALDLVPGYADAHYNVALAYERLGERRRALRHWMAYARLDPVGPWATHAKAQARKTLALEKLRVVSRKGQQVSA